MGNEIMCARGKSRRTSGWGIQASRLRVSASVLAAAACKKNNCKGNHSKGVSITCTCIFQFIFSSFLCVLRPVPGEEVQGQDAVLSQARSLRLRGKSSLKIYALNLVFIYFDLRIYQMIFLFLHISNYYFFAKIRRFFYRFFFLAETHLWLLSLSSIRGL